MQVRNLRPGNLRPKRGLLQFRLCLLHGVLNFNGNIDGNERAHHFLRSSRRTASSAYCEAKNLNVSRSKVSTCRCTAVPLAVANPIYTNPTGFSGVPPVGPAIPVVLIPKSAPAPLRTPSAISFATGSLTAPCSASVFSDTPSNRVFDSLEY